MGLQLHSGVFFWDCVPSFFLSTFLMFPSVFFCVFFFIRVSSEFGAILRCMLNCSCNAQTQVPLSTLMFVDVPSASYFKSCGLVGLNAAKLRTICCLSQIQSKYKSVTCFSRDFASLVASRTVYES